METEAIQHAVLEGRLPEGATVILVGFGQKLLNLIRSTRTQTGLSVTAHLDRRYYPTGIEPTSEQLSMLRLKPREVLPDSPARRIKAVARERRLSGEQKSALLSGLATCLPAPKVTPSLIQLGDSEPVSKLAASGAGAQAGREAGDAGSSGPGPASSVQ